MKYKGQELTEFKTTESIFFDKPKKMLVWDDASTAGLKYDVVAVIPRRESYPVIGVKHTWKHCAEIPEQPKLATVRQLAQWVRKNGEVRYEFLPMGTVIITSDLHYEPGEEDKEVSCMEKRKFNATKVYVRKWEDTEWHEPTREYLGLEK
jgi:hypothetical protein